MSRRLFQSRRKEEFEKFDYQHFATVFSKMSFLADLQELINIELLNYVPGAPIGISLNVYDVNIILSTIKNNKYFKKEFNKLMKTYINDYLKNNPVDDNPYLSIPYDVVSLDDKVGDITQLHDKFRLGVKNRQKPFLIINGELHMGEFFGDTHAYIVQNLYENLTAIGKIKSGEIYSLLNTDDIHIGYVANDIAYILIDKNKNCDIYKAVEKLDKSLYLKIYSYRDDLQTIKLLWRK